VRAHGKDEPAGVKAFFQGGEYLSRLVKRLGRLIVDETEKWGEVIRAANIRPE
jgi:hypothetical protein